MWEKLAACAVVVGVGVGIVVLFTGRPILRALDARSWLEVPCEIRSSRVEVARSARGSSTRGGGRAIINSWVVIEYAYEVGGKSYLGNRYTFGSWYSTGGAAQRIVNAYPPGETRVCFVNPADPEDAVLQRLARNHVLGLLGLPVVFLGLGAADSTIEKERRARRIAAAQKALQESLGSVDLELVSPPLLSLVIGAAQIASLVVPSAAFYLFASREPPLASADTTPCLAPFVISGLVLSLFVMMVATNLRPVITVERGVLPREAPFTVSWRTEGRMIGRSGLDIVLTARDRESGERRGNARVLCETDDPALVKTGSATLTLTPESLASSSDVGWWLEVLLRGTVSLKAEVEIRVV